MELSDFGKVDENLKIKEFISKIANSFKEQLKNKEKLSESQIAKANDVIVSAANLISKLDDMKKDELKSSAIRFAKLVKANFSEDVLPSSFRDEVKNKQLDLQKQLEVKTLDGGTQLIDTYKESREYTNSSVSPSRIAEKLIVDLKNKFYASAQDAYDGNCEDGGSWVFASAKQKCDLAKLLKFYGFNIQYDKWEKLAQKEQEAMSKKSNEVREMFKDITEKSKTVKADDQFGRTEVPVAKKEPRYCSKCKKTTTHSVTDGGFVCSECEGWEVKHKKKSVLDKYLKSVGQLEGPKKGNYERVVFLKDSEADEAMGILDEQGPDAAINFLSEWHMPGRHGTENTPGFGDADEFYTKDGYILSWNSGLHYIGLAYNQDYKRDLHEDENLLNKSPLTPDEEAHYEKDYENKLLGGQLVQSGEPYAIKNQVDRMPPDMTRMGDHECKACGYKMSDMTRYGDGAVMCPKCGAEIKYGTIDKDSDPQKIPAPVSAPLIDTSSPEKRSYTKYGDEYLAMLNKSAEKDEWISLDGAKVVNPELVSSLEKQGINRIKAKYLLNQLKHVQGYDIPEKNDQLKTVYRAILLEGDEATTAFKILNERGEYDAFHYLANNPFAGKQLDQKDLGSDRTYVINDMIMFWNNKAGYIGFGMGPKSYKLHGSKVDKLTHGQMPDEITPGNKVTQYESLLKTALEDINMALNSLKFSETQGKLHFPADDLTVAIEKLNSARELARE